MMPDELPRLPPADLAAEQTLLGGLLRGGAATLSAFAPDLAPDHFADPVHGVIFRTMQRHAEAGELVNLATIAEACHAGALDLSEVGGAGYLCQLRYALPDAPDLAAAARAIRDTWRQRQILDLAEHLSELAADAGGGWAATRGELVRQFVGKLAAPEIARLITQAAASGGALEVVVSSVGLTLRAKGGEV